MDDYDCVYSSSHVGNICRVYVCFTDILFTFIIDCICLHIDMVFVNFKANMATLKNRVPVIYSECATLYRYV